MESDMYISMQSQNTRRFTENLRIICDDIRNKFIFLADKKLLTC